MNTNSDELYTGDSSPASIRKCTENALNIVWYKPRETYYPSLLLWLNSRKNTKKTKWKLPSLKRRAAKRWKNAKSFSRWWRSTRNMNDHSSMLHNRALLMLPLLAVSQKGRQPNKWTKRQFAKAKRMAPKVKVVTAAEARESTAAEARVSPLSVMAAIHAARLGSCTCTRTF